MSPLAADNVLRLARESQQQNSLLSPADAVVLVLHAAMLATGFRLVAFRENDAPFEKDVSASNAQELPSSWNAGSGSYTFRYRHSQSALTFLLRFGVMSKTLMVHGMGVEDGKIVDMNVDMTEYLSVDAMDTKQYPKQLSTSDSTTTTNNQKLSMLLKQDKLNDLLYKLKINMIQKLIPGLNKEGYEETRTAEGTRQDNEQQQSSRRQSSQRSEEYGGRAEPSRPMFEPHNGPFMGNHPMVSPFSIGHSDLDPLGGMRPLGGTPFGGGSRGYPVLGSDPSSGGMYMDMNHPMFHGGMQGGGGGIQGGDGVLPRGAVPPGARFDPIVPGQAPVGPCGFGGRMGGVPGGLPRSGEPDPDEMQPPGYNDMFM